jgi:trehalose 6-phosphate phosphatase
MMNPAFRKGMGMPDQAGTAAGTERIDLDSALRRISGTERLLVALDFDGTMAPIVERAGDARSLPGSAAALEALAQLPDTTTALISGRALDSLRIVANPGERILLIGSHGAETWTGPDAEPLSLTEEQAALLKEATVVVQSVVDTHPGTVLENKPAGVVLHTRTADDAVAAAATEAARVRLGELEGLHLTDGKRVLECSVVHANKGEGLELLRSLADATAVLFAGDDVTDEHAMEILQPQDVGIKIGPGRTAAGFRVDSPAAFQHVLERLVELRSGATAG